MSKALSADSRERVVAVIAGGASRRAAAHSGGRPLSAIRWAPLARKVAERTLHDLWNTIGRVVAIFTPAECANYFAAARYGPD
jgi:hypothetical protein